MLFLAVPLIAAAEILDGASHFLTWAAAILRAAVMLTVTAVRRPFLNVTCNDLGNLSDWRWQLGLNSVEHSAINVETTNSMRRLYRPFDFNALSGASRF